MIPKYIKHNGKEYVLEKNTYIDLNDDITELFEENIVEEILNDEVEIIGNWKEAEEKKIEKVKLKWILASDIEIKLADKINELIEAVNKLNNNTNLENRINEILTDIYKHDRK